MADATSTTVPVAQELPPTLGEITSPATSTIEVNRNFISSGNAPDDATSTDLTTTFEALTTLPPLESESPPQDSLLSSFANKTASKPLTTFTCFGKLPPELRVKIWKEAATSPEVFGYNPDGGPNWNNSMYPHAPQYPKPIRAILGVNKESRYETIETIHSYPLLTLELWHLNSVWQVRFNLEVDIFHCAKDEFYDPWMHTLRGLGSPSLKELGEVQRLAISIFTGLSIFPDENMDALRPFTNLVEITIYYFVTNSQKFPTDPYKVMSQDEFVRSGASRWVHDYDCRRWEMLIDWCVEEGMWKQGRPTIRWVGPVSQEEDKNEDNKDEEEPKGEDGEDETEERVNA